MSGIRAVSRIVVRRIGFCITIAAALGANVRSAYAVVKIFDGFEDADRNNDGAITGYDTDWNDSGTFNDPGNAADVTLNARGITEVTTANNASDVGIVWSGIRSYDSATNLAKSKLRIINDTVAIGAEASTDIHNQGYALGVESRGGGSSFIGKFGQSIVLGPVAGDKVVVSLDWRVWREANDNLSQPSSNNALRWGIYQDTDGEFGQTANYGNGWFNNGGGTNGAPVVWGRDDGKWFDSAPGAEGDKGISTELTFGNLAVGTAARIRWETNVAGINGGDNGRILEGTNDTSTIASPPNNGPGGIISDLSTGPTPFKPHALKMEIVRLANGLLEAATFVDNIEFLRDTVKDTDTNYNALQPLPFTYDYVAFRNATNDWDYVIDNLKVEIFGSLAGVAGDYNNDGSVNAGDYVLWRKGIGTLANEVADVGTFSAADYTEWRARFGNPSGSGSSLGGGGVPEPGSVWLLLSGAIALRGFARRRSA